MALTTSALTLIGRRHPAIFDLLGNPYGPFTSSRGAEVSLNPQPLPPGPPDGMRTGFHAGAAEEWGTSRRRRRRTRRAGGAP